MKINEHRCRALTVTLTLHSTDYSKCIDTHDEDAHYHDIASDDSILKMNYNKKYPRVNQHISRKLFGSFVTTARIPFRKFRLRLMSPYCVAIA